MSDQVEYYDQFGRLHEQSILNCPRPELWTTDYDQQGPVYREMKERLETQEAFIRKYFKKEFPVLDIGCGFGRQAYWLAKEGFRVTGTDSSSVFIEIAEKLFAKHLYAGEFKTSRLLELAPPENYSQVLILDVLEHIPVSERPKAVKHIHTLMKKDGILFITLPHVRKRLTSFINNQVLKRLKSQFHYFRNREEHPYTIPGKDQLLKLCNPYFTLIEFRESPKTDYYIFRKN